LFMKYNSTRSKEFECNSAYAIKTGLAHDGGLFVPSEIPAMSIEDIEAMVPQSFAERAVKILRSYLTDYTDAELTECVNAVYTKEKFETDSVTPVYKLNSEVYFLELWHGVTCAFKDVALQMLPHLLTRAIAKTGEEKTAVILVATSGDTGKAALEGFKDVKGTEIAVFYPRDGVSDIQRLQMVTQEGENVTVGGINGNFDDAQSGVKAIFNDAEYNKMLEEKGYMLSSANSINWGRLVPQIIYYFSSYCDLLKNEEIELGEKVNFVVPTGNFGDILAGYYAMLMGLPVGKLICASNKNDVLTEFINTGVYNKNREFYVTSSPSMDILISSNLERFLYDVTGKDCARVKAWMEELAESGKYEIPNITKQRIKEIMWGGFCDEENTSKTIKDVFDEYGYIMDPHTAVAKYVYDEYAAQTEDKTKTIILSTASPFKFNGSVLKALKGEEALEGKNEFELLEQLSEITNLKVPASLSGLRGKEVRFDYSVEKENMKNFLNSRLNIE